jgi:hypothetical protein
LPDVRGAVVSGITRGCRHGGSKCFTASCWAASTPVREREEAILLDALLRARQDAGLTPAQVAERMGTRAPALARLERAPASCGRPMSG